MTLSFLIALTTGARIQTIFTLRKMHFEKKIKDGESKVNIKVGYGTYCDTKFNITYMLTLPLWLYKNIQKYLKSSRYEKREKKAKHIFEELNEQYIFLTNRGKPFFAANNDPYRDLYKEIPSGATVRQFIYTTLNKQLRKDGLEIGFSFHDLRATFGINLLNNLMILVDKNELKLFTALNDIKQKMGHRSLAITQKYLDYRNKHKDEEIFQINYETFFKDKL